MNRFIFFLALSFLISCGETENDTSTTATQEDKNANAESTVSSANIDVNELAEQSCACVKELSEERALITKYREEGNKAEALKLITSSRQTQRKAYDCSKPLMESIRYDQEKWPGFENALLSKCPQGGTALLIMHDIHYKE